MARICLSCGISLPRSRLKGDQPLARCVQAGLSLINRLQAGMKLQQGGFFPGIAMGQKIGQKALHAGKFICADRFHMGKLSINAGEIQRRRSALRALIAKVGASFASENAKKQ